ncbi:unnamed protein product [Symbiodinium necroappetens]|uniref:Rhodanese domain-containing protein n=1 Tax=Symbiodinium necroappetens TaxID=1628268 RepID=A0A812KZL8_9DINO|nr:unnamed protein product [Symbiodinium necroappetens]
MKAGGADKGLVQQLVDLVNSGKTLVCLSDACVKGNINRGHVSRCRHIAQYLVEMGADRARIVRMTGGINAWKKAQLDGILGDLRPMYAGVIKASDFEPPKEGREEEEEDEETRPLRGEMPAAVGNGGYASAAPQLAAGLQVEIQGLVSRADLNGKKARIQEFIPSSERWEVELLDETKERVRCKPECLKAALAPRLCADPPSWHLWEDLECASTEEGPKAAPAAPEEFVEDKIIKVTRSVGSLARAFNPVRTTGELFVGSVGGVWAELDVAAGEKKGTSAGKRGWIYIKAGRKSLDIQGTRVAKIGPDVPSFQVEALPERALALERAAARSPTSICWRRISAAVCISSSTLCYECCFFGFTERDCARSRFTLLKAGVDRQQDRAMLRAEWSMSISAICLSRSSFSFLMVPDIVPGHIVWWKEMFCDIFDPETSSWTSLPAAAYTNLGVGQGIFERAAFFGAAAVEGRVVALVGSVTIAYNPRVPEDGWRAVEAPNSHVKVGASSCACAFRGELIVASGRPRCFSKCVAGFRFSADASQPLWWHGTWRQLPKLQSARVGGALVEVYDRLYITGGVDEETGEFYDTAERLAEESWDCVSWFQMPRALHAHEAHALPYLPAPAQPLTRK